MPSEKCGGLEVVGFRWRDRWKRNDGSWGPWTDWRVSACPPWGEEFEGDRELETEPLHPPTAIESAREKGRRQGLREAAHALEAKHMSTDYRGSDASYPAGFEAAMDTLDDLLPSLPPEEEGKE